MDQLTQHLLIFISHYGSISLFFLLAFGIVGLPIPDETLLAITGLLIAQGKLPLFWSFSAALLGSICGITVSYLLGRVTEKYLLEKYGPRIGITHEKIQYAHTWFEKFGKWTLLIGYFIPGVRHLVGYIAGSTLVHYRIFALFAYIGALLWVTTFLLLGYFLGDKIFTILQNLDLKILYVVVAIGILLLLYYLFWLKRRSKD